MIRRYCSVNNWLIDISSGSVLHLQTGERKRLGEYQLKLLDILTQDAGKIFTREELTQLVWERRVIGNNSLPNAIHALRTALEDDGKKQKIIKTIPRKGYQLEPHYCCIVEQEENDVHAPHKGMLPDEDIPTAIPTALSLATEEDKPVVPDIIAYSDLTPPVTPKRKLAFWGIGLLVLILTVASSVLATRWYLGQNSNDLLVAREIQPDAYSNIEIYSVEMPDDPSYMSDNLYIRLKDTMYVLNQQIKMQSVTMNVYFRSINNLLNYSFSLTSSCDKKQLSMTIHHWRIDAAQLNNLILRETRRKLNEMATCTKES